MMQVARVKRLRWWLVLAVMIVTFDFVRVSMATLSPDRQMAEAASLASGGPAVAAPQTAGTQEAPVAVDHAPLENPFEALAPSVASAATDAEPETGNSEVATQIAARDACYLHPGVWPAQMVVNFGPRAWRLFSRPRYRLRDAAGLLTWSSTTAARDRNRPFGRDRGPSQEGGFSRGNRPSRSAVDPSARLVLGNSPTTDSDVHFVVNDKIYSLSPGETLQLTGERHWVVRFHRGGMLEDEEYLLRPGEYDFVVTEVGWDIFRLDR